MTINEEMSSYFLEEPGEAVENLKKIESLL